MRCSSAVDEAAIVSMNTRTLFQTKMALTALKLKMLRQF